MPKWLKIMILVAIGGCVVFGAGSALAYRWFKGNLAGWSESAKVQGDAGAAFGKGKASDACVAEAVRQLRISNSFSDELAHKFFLKACLGAATQPAGWCDDVPDKSELLGSVSWSLKKCTEVDMLNDQTCNRLMQTIQEHCHPVKSKAPAAQ
jgi:hypothetical protein